MSNFWRFSIAGKKIVEPPNWCFIWLGILSLRFIMPIKKKLWFFFCSSKKVQRNAAVVSSLLLKFSRSRLISSMITITFFFRLIAILNSRASRSFVSLRYCPANSEPDKNFQYHRATWGIAIVAVDLPIPGGPTINATRHSGSRGFLRWVTIFFISSGASWKTSISSCHVFPHAT